MTDLETLFAGLGRSDFRSRFRLGAKEARYLSEHGIGAVLNHAREFIRERLAPPEPRNDGKQTPMRGHPVFVGQHATATCCRGCLQKWHSIPTGQPLDAREQEYILAVLRRWLELQGEWPAEPRQGTLL